MDGILLHAPYGHRTAGLWVWSKIYSFHYNAVYSIVLYLNVSQQATTYWDFTEYVNTWAVSKWVILAFSWHRTIFTNRD